MKIDIYCAGSSKNDGLYNQMGGCGFILVFTDKFNRQLTREFHYGLGASDKNLSELTAIRMALAAVLPPYRGVKTTINTLSGITAELLIDNSVIVDAAGLEARRWYSYYKNASVLVHAEPHALLRKAMELAKRGLDTQIEYDSMTQGDDNVVAASPVRSN